MGEPTPEIVVLERREGGSIYEVSQSSEQRLWDKIVDYSEGKRISFTWYPGLAENQATLVTVTFALTDANKTDVTLVHEGWEVRGAEAESMCENYVTGWKDIIEERFRSFVDVHYGPS